MVFSHVFILFLMTMTRIDFDANGAGRNLQELFKRMTVLVLIAYCNYTYQRNLNVLVELVKLNNYHTSVCVSVQ